MEHGEKTGGMNDEDKSREQLLEELAEQRLRIAALEAAEAELARTKKALDRGAEALRAVLENALDTMALISPDGILRHISVSVERTTGYKPEQIIGAYVFDYVHAEDVQALLDGFTRWKGMPGKTCSDEFRYRHGDGSWHVMEVSGINLINNPTVSGIVLTARDITERKMMEEAVQKRESYFRSLIRNAVDMICVLNPDFTLRWGSRSAGRLTGYRPADIYDHLFYDFIHPDDVGEVRDIIESVLESPGASSYYENRFLHADGSYHFHEVIVSNLLDDPSVRGLVINSRDVSERKMMEEKLRARNRELDAFAYTVSHDLRTPLALVEGYAQLMRAEDTTDEEKEKYLKSIVAAARRMDELTESLLEYAQAGQPGGEAAQVDPTEVISEVLSEQADVLEWYNIEVVVDEPLPLIYVDPLKLRQVFTNLVGNAVKYTGEYPHPRLEIGSKRDAGAAIFHVRDNGPGIDARLLEDVFLPFKRFGGSAAHSLGIGLSTVKKAVEGWGGNIWVESDPSEGTTFFFTAPTAE